MDTKDELTSMGVSSQGSDSQQLNFDLHAPLNTVSSTSSCVIS